jgi:hypothetical protein
MGVSGLLCSLARTAAEQHARQAHQAAGAVLLAWRLRLALPCHSGRLHCLQGIEGWWSAGHGGIQHRVTGCTEVLIKSAPCPAHTAI